MAKTRSVGAYTLVELLLCMAIMAVTLGILLGVYALARPAVYRSSCLSSQRQAGIALLTYAQENDGYFPDEANWDGRRWLRGTALKPESLRCPAADYRTIGANAPGLPGYAINLQLTAGNPMSSRPEVRLVGSIGRPSSVVMLCEQIANISATALADPFGGKPPHGFEDYRTGFTRHYGGANYTFVDGHTKWYKPEQVSDQRRDTDELSRQKTIPDARPTFWVR